MRTKRWMWGLALVAGVLLEVPSAFAIIGRPLTPMSYAGVARRTTRRAVAVGAAGVAAYPAYPAYAAPAVVAPSPYVPVYAPAARVW